MADNNEEILRRSLKEVDRHRNWLLVGFVVTAALLISAFGMAARRMHSDSHSLGAFLHDVLVILGIWTGMMTFVVVLQVTTMTKRILRAIELSSRK